jgi:hypothetical protein
MPTATAKMTRPHPAERGREAEQRAAGKQEHRGGDPEAARQDAAYQHRRAQDNDEFKTEQRKSFQVGMTPIIIPGPLGREPLLTCPASAAGLVR